MFFNEAQKGGKMLSIRTAFISAYNKTGLSERIAKLTALGVEIWASGGTATHLTQLACKFILPKTYWVCRAFGWAR
jgi:hypothetical protein